MKHLILDVEGPPLDPRTIVYEIADEDAANPVKLAEIVALRSRRWTLISARVEDA